MSLVPSKNSLVHSIGGSYILILSLEKFWVGCGERCCVGWGWWWFIPVFGFSLGQAEENSTVKFKKKNLLSSQVQTEVSLNHLVKL